MGGDVGPPCPPNADCWRGEIARDGAAFDPVSGTWRELADAPIDILPASAVFAAGQLFITVVDAESRTTLVSYEVAEDRWKTWDAPGDLPLSLVADGDRVVFVSPSDEQEQVSDLVLDVASGEWSELPPDPLGRAFDRMVTVTPAGLVLTAKELVASPGSEMPALTIAALYDEESGEWSRLPDTGQIGGWRWMWTGSRLVDPQLGSEDGGQVGNWGRPYPYGGSITLPDGTWAPLTGPPDPLPDDAWIQDGPVSTRFALSGGYVYDAQLDSWTPAGRPDAAPTAPGPAIWADDVLLVLGGTDWSGTEGTYSTATWTYTPAE